jgi:hypothetical protein
VHLVERGGACANGAAALEQEQAQILPGGDAAAQRVQPLAAEQPFGRTRGVDQVVLAAPAFASRPLDLADGQSDGDEQAGETGPVAAGPLEREGRLAQLARPREQLRVAGARRLDLTACDLYANPIERHRGVSPLVRVDPDCDRPLHRLASLSVGTRGRYGTELCPAKAQASIRSPAGRVERGGRQVQRKALKPAWCRVIPLPLHSQQPTGQQPASTHATQLGARDPGTGQRHRPNH